MSTVTFIGEPGPFYGLQSTPGDSVRTAVMDVSDITVPLEPCETFLDRCYAALWEWTTETHKNARMNYDTYAALLVRSMLDNPMVRPDAFGGERYTLLGRIVQIDSREGARHGKADAGNGQ
jgi:hypothetical protein